MKSFWIHILTLAIWLVSAASHRIITVDHHDDLTCIVEDANETISWEFENHHSLDINKTIEIQNFEIWPVPRYFNLNSTNWTVTSKSDGAFPRIRFGPVTDFQWNEFDIVELKNKPKRIKIKEPGNATHLQFSLLSNSSVTLKITLKNSQHDYELKIDSTSIQLVEDKNVTVFQTYLHKKHVDGNNIHLNSFKNASITNESELENGVRWKSYDFYADLTTMQLKSEGRNLINQSIVTDAQELLNFLEIEANGTAKLKVHDYDVAVVPCDEGSTMKGMWNLDVDKRACIEVTYFSQNTSLTLTIQNVATNYFNNATTLLAADDWKIERFLSEEVLPSGNYTFEIKSNGYCKENESVIRRIRFCNANEYFVYKMNKNHTALANKKKCYSLATKTSQDLSQNVNTELTQEKLKINSDLKDYVESEFKKQNGNSKSAVVCISTIGCFCWVGWKGATCTEECRANEYGINCNGQCGHKCTEPSKGRMCDLQKGECIDGCRDALMISPACTHSNLKPDEKKKDAETPSLLPVYVIIVLALFAASAVLMYAIKKYNGQDATLSNSIGFRLSTVRYGELHSSSGKISTKETFRIRFEDALHNGQLEREYESLPRGQLNSWDVGTNPQNWLKNRYIEIAAYDFNRVILGGASNYINASYIKDHQNRNAYIAAQGPKSETLDDFWRMIWQERASTIVMLGQVFEGKSVMCQQYWPPLGCQMTIGDFSIVCNTEKKYVGFVKRTLFIRHPPVGSRQVIQLHYNEWSRNGLPTDLSSLASFMQIIQSKRQTPIVVHCSGGTGRTGTIILVDQCLRKLTLDNRVDVFKTMESMRRERVNAVENFEQYELAYKLIMQYFGL